MKISLTFITLIFVFSRVEGRNADRHRRLMKNKGKRSSASGSVAAGSGGGSEGGSGGDGGGTGDGANFGANVPTTSDTDLASCFRPRLALRCGNAACTDAVCARDSQCCSRSWYGGCVTLANELCKGFA